MQSETLPAQAVSEMPLARLRVSVRWRRRTPRELRIETSAVIERLVGAVEDEAFEQDAVGVVGGDEGAAAGELQRRRPGRADETRAGAQLEGADTIAPGG